MAAPAAFRRPPDNAVRLGSSTAAAAAAVPIALTRERDASGRWRVPRGGRGQPLWVIRRMTLVVGEEVSHRKP